MKIIDVSGPIYEGMWSYGDPFPDFKLINLKEPDWIESYTPKVQEFEGFHMLTGTYIDGPSHAFGLERSYPMHAIEMKKIFDIDAYVMKFNLKKLAKEGKRPYISLEDIKEAEKVDIPERAAIIFATGWGEHWDKPDFLSNAWFFKKEAIEYLISKKPFIMAGDTAYFDNVENEQGNWNLIYGNGILVLAPLVNLERIDKHKVKLYVCPLNILNTTGLPCRVIIKEE